MVITMKIFSTVLFCVVLFFSGESKATSEDLWSSGSGVLGDEASTLNYPGPILSIKKVILYEPERSENPCDVVWNVPFFLMTPVEKMVTRVCGYIYPNQSNHSSGIIVKAKDIAFHDYMRDRNYYPDNVEVVTEQRFPYFQEDEELVPSDQNLFVYKKQGKVEVRFSLLRVDVIH